MERRLSSFQSVRMVLSWPLLVSLLISVFIASVMSYGYHFPSVNHYMDVPVIQSMLDPGLFSNDYYVQEMGGFTPRYYYYYLIYFPVKLGLSFPVVHFVYYLLAFCSFIFGLVALGTIVRSSRLALVILPFLGLAATYGTVGVTSLFYPSLLPFVLATGLSVWGIYFCFRRRWILAYALFGIASLVQLLVGLLPGLLMAPVLILELLKTVGVKGMLDVRKAFDIRNGAVRNAACAFVVLAGFLSLVYLPMLISGTTGTKLFDGREFVYIYGVVRHPHHIIPSTWGLYPWVNWILFMVGGSLCIYLTDSLRTEDKLKMWLVLGASVFALALGYVFVELYPLALFAKLQLARVTPFAQLIVLIGISALASDLYRRGNIALSMLLLVAAIIPYGPALLLLSMGLMIPQIRRRFQSSRYNLVTWMAVAGAWAITITYSPSPENEIVVGPVLLFILASPFLLEKGLRFRLVQKARKAIYGVTIACVVFFLLGLGGALPGQAEYLFQKKVQLYPISQDAVGKLALRFSESSPKTALVLVPPSVEKFKLYSERAVVVNFQNFPYTDRGIHEWVERMEAVLGVPVGPWAYKPEDMDYLFRNRTAQELVDVARQYDAGYMLTQVDWHPSLHGQAIDQEGDWMIVQIDMMGN